MSASEQAGTVESLLREINQFLREQLADKGMWYDGALSRIKADADAWKERAESLAEENTRLRVSLAVAAELAYDAGSGRATESAYKGWARLADPSE